MLVVNTIEALARLAAHGLPGAATSPVDVDSLEELLAAAEAQRVVPWVSAAVDAGLVPQATEEWQRRLRERVLASVQTTLGTHAAAASVVTRLAAGGVTDVRVLKGCATGPLDHPRPTDRFSSDVDLLISRDDLLKALATFSTSPVPCAPGSPRWQQHYGKGATVHDDHGVEVDIHVMLGQGYFGLAIPFGELMAHADDFTIGGVQMSGLDGPSRLMHAAHHVGVPSATYSGIHSRRDVLQLALASDDHWQEAIDRATRWKVDALVARGVVTAWSAFDVDPHPLLEWAQRHEPVGRQRVALQLVDDHHGGHFLTAPLALPPQRWPGYVLPLMFPSRAYLAEQGATWSGRARSVISSLKPG